MAEIQLAGTSLASESGGTITINNGTLSSGVVFPAGHVIQTVWNIKSDEASTSTNSTTASITVDSGNNEEWFVTISDLITGSKVLLLFHFPARTNSSDNLTLSGFGICRDSISNHIYTASDARFGLVNGASGSIDFRSYLTLVYIDTPTSSSHTYKLTQRSISSGDYTTVQSGSESPAIFVAQEIAQ